jgi:farnesyl-diphosphate farnesyltransferase
MSLKQSASEVLKHTSRTFYPSIMQLPSPIREAVMSAYLLLRAIDEIEDHPELDKLTKIRLLSSISCEIKQQPDFTSHCFTAIFRSHRDQLPEVTSRIDEWLALSPQAVAPIIHRTTSIMAQRMAYWVNKEWRIRTKHDLDRYTFNVAGAVGILLSELWVWNDGTSSRKSDAISCGRGLQAINILRNRSEDLARGVDFFPEGWKEPDFVQYAKGNLLRGDKYVSSLPQGPIREFCRGPQALAHATLEALQRGEPKLSRRVVLEILGPQDPILASSPAEERVVLVNQDDEAIGIEEKIKAHRLGALHRAFSVFVLNTSGQLLLQKRAATKYHSGGLWSNTCCGHPRPDETVENAARRRLNEEMGFDSELRKLFHFVYDAKLENGITENEFDHVLLGHFDGVPKANSIEVADWKWMDLAMLSVDLAVHPEKYTYWFQFSFERFCQAARLLGLSLSRAITVSSANA